MKQTPDTTPRSDDTKPGADKTGRLETVTSAVLAALLRETEPALQRAKALGSGIRRWSADDEGVAGASLDSYPYQLPAADCSGGLDAMVRAASGSSTSEAAREVRIDALDANDAAIAAALRAWVPSGPEEQQALDQLTQQLAKSLQSHAELRGFDAKVLDATSRTMGVAVVDPKSCESVWLFARAVRMTAHRR